MLAEIRPQSYHEYLALPILGPLLDEFTIWSRTRGYTLGTVKNQLKDTRHIVRFFESDGLHHLEKLTHADFERAWQFFRLDKPSVAGTVRQLECFIDSIHGLPPLSPSPKTRSDVELHQFSDYLKRVRGLVDSTIQSHLNYLHRFLDLIAFDSNPKVLANLRLSQIEEFLHCLSQSLNRDSLQHVVGYLRSFLRFEYSRGVIEEPLHEMIDSPRLYRLEKLPCSLSWEVVDELLGLIDRTTPQGMRNYTMLLLAATYGLRSCEVVSLKLDDINWRKAKVNITQAKNDNQLILPLTDAIANALIDYLKNARPDLPYREVFLRVRAPHGTLKPTAVAEAFQREVRLSGLDIPYQGPHCLRHSFAVHLLRKGTSVKEIGDVLGHHSTESSCVYLRLAVDDLRGVTLEVPECLDGNVKINQNILKDLPPVRTFRNSTSPGPPRSFLNERINAYLKLHRSLGKKFSREETVLLSFDSFLASQCPEVTEINGKIFNEWSKTLAAYTPTDRRNRMRIVRNLCLYLKRFWPNCFVPDVLTFPASQSQFTPFILSQTEIARLLHAAGELPTSSNSPLRPQGIRLAIILLYTTGIRRGELIRLTLGDFNSLESTLFIGTTKFHKQRIIPLSTSTDAELRSYFKLRSQLGLPMDPQSPIIWNRSRNPPGGKAYTGTGLRQNWRLLCASLGILTEKGVPPRVHDLRHSFAVNALLRWYHNGDDMLTKLPHLSTYMGHVNIVSTQCYLPFVEPLRSAACTLFEQQYGSLVHSQVEAPNKKILDTN